MFDRAKTLYFVANKKMHKIFFYMLWLLLIDKSGRTWYTDSTVAALHRLACCLCAGGAFFPRDPARVLPRPLTFSPAPRFVYRRMKGRVYGEHNKDKKQER